MFDNRPGVFTQSNRSSPCSPCTPWFNLSLYIKKAVMTKSSASVTIDENTTVRVVA
jgi:hypothetical protein